MKKRKRWFAGGLFMVFLMGCICMHPMAAQEDKIFIFFGTDGSSETPSITAAAVLDMESGYCVLAPESALCGENGVYYLFDETGTAICELSYMQAFDGTGLCLFKVEGEFPAEQKARTVDQVSVVKDQVVNVVYLDSQTTAASCKLQFTKADTDPETGFTVLDGIFTEGEMDPSGYYLPILFIDDQGGLAGIFTEKGCIYAMATATDSFYNDGGGQSPDPSPEPESTPESEPVPESEPDTAPEPEPTSGGAVRPGPAPEPDTGSGKGLLVVAVIGIAAAGVIGWMAASKSSKKKPDLVSPAPVPPSPAPPVPTPPAPAPPTPAPPAPAPPTPAPPAPVPPSPVPPVPAPVTARASVTAAAGVLQGRNWQIGAEGVTIGRDSSCNILFPADVKGISRMHCRLFWDQGRLMIMDCGSSYGTLLAGYGKLQNGCPVAVKNGDTFYLASEKVAFTVQM